MLFALPRTVFDKESLVVFGVSDCRSNSLGVRNDLRWIPDAQMTAYKSNGNSFASSGRLSGGGWRGVDASSWLQVDLGRLSMQKRCIVTDNITRLYGIVIYGHTFVNMCNITHFYGKATKDQTCLL